MELNRRHYLSAMISALALSGCNQLSSGQDTPEQFVDETVTINEYEFESFSVQFDLERVLTLETSVVSGPAIDVLFIMAEDLDAFENNDDYTYNTALSQLDTQGEQTSATVAPGEYYLLVDYNSRDLVQRERETPRSVEVSVTLTGAVPTEQ